MTTLPKAEHILICLGFPEPDIMYTHSSKTEKQVTNIPKPNGLKQQSSLTHKTKQSRICSDLGEGLIQWFKPTKSPWPRCLGNMMASVLPGFASSYHTIREREHILWFLPWKTEKTPAFKKPRSFFLFLIGYGVPNPEYSQVVMEMDYVDWLKLIKDTLKIRGWWWGLSMPPGIYIPKRICALEKNFKVIPKTKTAN